LIDAAKSAARVPGVPRQDKQRKDRDERDEDERDEDEREEEDEDEDESSEEDEEEDESEDEDEARKAKASDDSDGDDGERDERAQRVAKALGVSDDEDGEAKEGAEGASEDKPEEADAAKPNRAVRRREEALARRKKRAAAEGSTSSDDQGSSKDKNARAKELLKRRREQAASAAKEPVANSLDAGEMVDDALARTAAAIGKWFKSNVQIIQWIVLIGLVGAVGYVLYNSRVEKKAGEASAKLMAGVAADRGIVLEEDKRPDDEKEYDSRKVFKTTAERADAALSSFGGVVEQHAGSGAALLAKLGQGSAYLEKKEYDKAISSYSEVLSSPLAAADPDVKGRATEGTAFAKEGKGDLDGALTSFKELSGIDVKGYKELSTYHEARILFAKGDKVKAKELLEPLNSKLAVPATEPQPLGYLKGAVGDLMTQIDPSATAAPAKLPGAKMPTPEELQDMARRALEQKAPPKTP
jgi:predicted negative regulator of RcsB-dependent stress response